MKILLLKDLYFIEHHSLEQTRPRIGPGESAGNEVRRSADQTLDVQPDAESEKVEHKDGHTWFILSETGKRFQIPNTDFTVPNE